VHEKNQKISFEIGTR